MKRYDLSLFLDARVRVILILVIVAILIAIFLTYMEFRVKKRQEKKEAKSAEDLFIENFLKKINLCKSPREKLDFLDKTAKNFFNKEFGTKTSSDYSDLIEQLKKHKDVPSFCNSMFDAYYSSEIIDSKVNSLSKIFIKIFRNTWRKKSKPQKPSLLDKLEPLFIKQNNNKKKNLSKKIILIKNFCSGKLKIISKFFIRNKKENLNLNWIKNFKDMNKKLLIKSNNIGGIHDRMLQRALILKQKEIARKKLEKETMKKKKVEKRGTKIVKGRKGKKRYLTYNL